MSGYLSPIWHTLRQGFDSLVTTHDQYSIVQVKGITLIRPSSIHDPKLTHNLTSRQALNKPKYVFHGDVRYSGAKYMVKGKV